MRLLLGGLAQGKLACAVALTGATEQDILLGEICAISGNQSALVLEGAHAFVKRCMEAGLDPLPLLEELIARNPDIVITAQELGCGIVPLERADREWRELMGRVCCALAEKAEHVDRVICGIRVPLK